MFEYFKSEVDNRSNFLKIPKNTSYDCYIIPHRAKEITTKKKKKKISKEKSKCGICFLNLISKKMKQLNRYHQKFYSIC